MTPPLDTTNTLFSQWLKEWWAEHAAKKGSEKLASVYKRVINQWFVCIEEISMN
jgi:hypothetical protein